MDAILKHAGVASQAYFRNRTSVIYLTVSPQETYAGSATCVAIDDRLFLATAAHNFNGIEQGADVCVFSANRSSDTPLRIIGSNFGQNLAKGAADVAWLEIDSESARTSDLTGVSLESIDAHPVLNDQGLYAASGFPVGFLREEHPRPGHTNYVVPLLVYFTHAINLDRNDDDPILLSFERSGIGPDGPGEMPEPHGMSGGGIWFIPGEEPPTTIWNPGRMRLSGITIEYVGTSGELKGLPMHQWLRVLSDDLLELRPELESLLRQ